MKWVRVSMVYLNKVLCHLMLSIIAIKVIWDKMLMKTMVSSKWKYLNNNAGIFCSMMCNKSLKPHNP